MNSIQKLYRVLCIAALAMAISCHKKEFLEAKPDSDLFVPTTLEDCQALLDNEDIMNETPVLGELSADNFYLPYAFWRGLNTKEKNAYRWLPATFDGLTGDISDWNAPYKQVFYANVILEALSHLPITAANEGNWRAIKGAALFARAHAFYQVAQVFAPVYNPNSPGEKLGIPLRLTPGVDEKSVRSSVHQTYSRILTDLLEAGSLLPAEIPFNNRNRSSRPAAFALLARTYLSMDNYPRAKVYADSCLLLHNTLIRYDTLNTQINNPFNKFNIETIYQSRFVTTNVLRGITVSNCIVDTNLYRSYAANDLRSVIFYRIHSSGNINPKIGYTGINQLFTGLATDEVYLIRAECLARMGHVQEAMDDLNALLKNRWRANSFVPFAAATADIALQKIMEERRKELPFRGLRWTDLRRLNKNGANITLKRMLDNPYQLAPGDLRYTLLFPPDVMNLSNMEQNPR
ncbi:RagB/SusD family nutrient uptake outer membrane protein [Paraflavitalea soli]|uniref:RagB/SusD family nutrient uptake outer membrane protein n=1 Tax=Paraflavitalea soli TaxID=2315862 RepID=A0A3B7MRL6_9BACT|nr:RagB/SusD family nutrient uptake outer membrane protein [Paraflavitalea soli]AXY75616.1 RagB/SusD family nutrient uptake outer membrane protein [Paraflavitalea soli]